MGAIPRDDKQLTLIYNNNTRVGKHTLSYLTAIDERYLSIDISKTKVPDTQWVEIAKDLGVKVGDLVDKRILDMDTESTSEFSTEDWLKIIQKNPDVITRPIAINGKRTKQIANPPEIMQFFEVDSAGLEESPMEGEPDIERTDEDETFIEKS